MVNNKLRDYLITNITKISNITNISNDDLMRAHNFLHSLYYHSLLRWYNKGCLGLLVILIYFKLEGAVMLVSSSFDRKTVD